MLRQSVIKASLVSAVALMGSTFLIAPAVAQGVEFQAVSSRASAPPAGSYGGGFIELLMTGRDPSQGRGAAMYNRPQTSVSERYGEALYGADPMTGRAVVRPPAQRRQQVAAVAATRAEYERPVEKALDPRWQMQTVDYNGAHRAGTVVIDTPNRFLYLVQSGGKALRYGIGVGRPGFSWAGVKSITRKAEWPDWRPPPEMLKRRPDLPRFMAGGPENPMGARGMYLGSTMYRIHGTNEPHTIGQAVSSGCIRMTNDDVMDLYGRVGVGTRVIVM